VLLGEGETAGCGACGTYDSGRGGKVVLRVQVHVAAHATAQTIGGTHAFLHDRRRVHAAKDHARSAAMVKGNRITVSEVIEHANVDTLFTDSEVHLAGNASFLPEASDRFLNPPASQHIAVEFNSIQFHLPLLQDPCARPATSNGFYGDRRSTCLVKPNARAQLLA
jgi:hypothetical protein